jgi:transcriptional regulator with XRE-family HTH domain
MPATIRDAIAAEVRAEMARQNKSQRDLGQALDLPQSSVSLRLSGKSAFRADEIVKVARFLGVSITKLTGDQYAATHAETPASAA